MPKLLVLFHSQRPDVIALAEAAADGARSVRFAEVELRRRAASDAGTPAAATGSVGRAHRTLDDAEDVIAYDGVILVLAEADDAGAAAARALGALGGSLVNRVGSVIAATDGAERTALVWSALTPMADHGMILVPMPFAGTDGPATESARRLGKRVAEVIGWVTHARSHHHHEPNRQDHHSHHHH